MLFPEQRKLLFCGLVGPLVLRHKNSLVLRARDEFILILFMQFVLKLHARSLDFSSFQLATLLCSNYSWIQHIKWKIFPK